MLERSLALLLAAAGAALLVWGEVMAQGASVFRAAGAALFGSALLLMLLARRSRCAAPPRREPNVSAPEALANALGDNDWYSRYLALSVIAELGEEFRPLAERIVPLLEDEHEWVREAASKALASVAPELLAEREETVVP